MTLARLLSLVLCTGLCMTLSVGVNAEGHGSEHDHSKHNHSGLHANVEKVSATTALFPEALNVILLKEMNALSQGLSQLMPEVTSGNWPQIQAIGQKMHDSYLLKQSLSKEQIAHLHKTLPGNFKTLDHQLHHSAGMMAHAAEKKNIELVNFYLYKMTETCVACHSQYATDRFPRLKPSKKHH